MSKRPAESGVCRGKGTSIKVRTIAIEMLFMDGDSLRKQALLYTKSLHESSEKRELTLCVFSF
jgi:hypothetical protein